MKNTASIIIAVLVLTLLALSAVPFIWESKKYDLNLFSQYGEFVSGVISALTLIIIVVAYQSTTAQIRLTQKQAFDSIFFNVIESHRLIVVRLQTGKHNVLEVEARELLQEISNIRRNNNIIHSDPFDYLSNELNNYLINIERKDFFDSYYFILSKKYNVLELLYEMNNEPLVVPNLIEPFFSKTSYIITNYINSLYWIIDHINDNKLLSRREKQVYLSLLMNTTTGEEKAILFYFIIWDYSKNPDIAEWRKSILEFYGYFTNPENHLSEFNLISHNRDWEAFLSIPSYEAVTWLTKTPIYPTSS